MAEEEAAENWWARDIFVSTAAILSNETKIQGRFVLNFYLKVIMG